MPQIFEVIANENAHYKRNELESCIDHRLDMVFLRLQEAAMAKLAASESATFCSHQVTFII